MKSPIRQTIATFLVLLYALVAMPAAIGATSAMAIGQGGGMCFSAISGDQLYSPPQSNLQAFSDRHSDPPAAFKILLHGLSAQEQSQVSADQAFLARYLRELADFPVRLRKSDLIFPFHYFW